MAARAKIVQDVHQLFVGANGHKTYGITVAAVDDSARWDINDYTCLAQGERVIDLLDLSKEEYRALADRMRRAVLEGNKHEVPAEPCSGDVL